MTSIRVSGHRHGGPRVVVVRMMEVVVVRRKRWTRHGSRRRMVDVRSRVLVNRIRIRIWIRSNGGENDGISLDFCSWRWWRKRRRRRRRWWWWSRRMVSPSTASTFTTAAANVSHVIIGVKPRSKRPDFLVTQMIKSRKFRSLWIRGLILE